MNKKMFALLMILCLLFSAACLAEEETQIDITLDGYMEAGGMLYVVRTDEACETGGLGMIGTAGQTIGDVLRSDGILSVEPMREGDVFEGWMEVALTVTVDEDGFEWEEYRLISDSLYTTEELLKLAVSDHNVMYVAKWAGIPAEEYFAPYEEEMIAAPSITLLSGDGALLISGEEERYEAAWTASTVEPGQSFGEALALDAIDVVAAEGKMFTGWMVYEYDVETMEISETPVDEEGVLCFEMFEDYHMVLRAYNICRQLVAEDGAKCIPIPTAELAEIVCEATDHVVIASWMTADEYLTFLKEQSAAIKSSLENAPLTQTELNQKSQELRELWDVALNCLLDKVKSVLPEDEMNALISEQTAWLEARNSAVETAGESVEGGSMYALVVNMEAANLTEARVYELYALLQ